MLALYIFDGLQQNSASTGDKSVPKPLETCCLQQPLLEITGTAAVFPPQLESHLTSLLGGAFEDGPHLPLSAPQ